MNRFILVLLLVPALASAAPAGWRQNLSPSRPGSFPLPREQKSRYRLGWFTFNAGEADATFSKPKRNTVLLEVKGGTIGFVRNLWRLDASHRAVAQAASLRPISIKQIENYGYRTITTSVAFNAQGVSSLRTVDPPDPVPPGSQKFQFPNVYDLQTALLYIRSQKLQPGDNLNIVVYPANAPYLATVHVIGREKIEVKAGKYNALKCELRLQKINRELGLEPHRKLKRAVAWISDDSDRLLLRAEADIFVGSVWVELQSVKFNKS